MTAGAPLRESILVALDALRASKLRSLLTLLGIILATATLIAVSSIIHGMDVYIATQVSEMGADGFRVRRLFMIGQLDPKKLAELRRRSPELSVEEYEFLRAHARLVREIGMESSRVAPVRYGEDQVEGVQVTGVTPNMGVISNTQTAQGRFFAVSENQKRAMVCFIGEDIRERFFTGRDPLGKEILIQGRPFRIIGVARKQGSVFGQSRDNFVWIPIGTFFKMFGSRTGIGYSALALDRARLNAARDEIRMLLRAHRHLPPADEDNFGIFGSDSLVEAWDRLTGVIAATALAVVSIFMVVGGVVIMNIMLAVVVERTREIGIRKSVGARRRDILNQFLVESSVLAASGGVIGVGLAWAAAVTVRSLTPVPMEMPAASVALGVGLSTLVGLFFGVYPARQASRLDPIEALRFET